DDDPPAPRGRTHLLGLVDLQDLLLLARLVVLEPLLARFHLRLKLAHRRHRLELFLGDREHDRADDERQADDRYAEIANGVEQPEQHIEDRNHEEAKPTPIDRPIEATNARSLITVERRDFLGSSEQSRFGAQRLPGSYRS